MKSVQISGFKCRHIGDLQQGMSSIRHLSIALRLDRLMINYSEIGLKEAAQMPAHRLLKPRVGSIRHLANLFNTCFYQFMQS